MGKLQVKRRLTQGATVLLTAGLLIAGSVAAAPAATAAPGCSSRVVDQQFASYSCGGGNGAYVRISYSCSQTSQVQRAWQARVDGGKNGIVQLCSGWLNKLTIHGTRVTYP